MGRQALGGISMLTYPLEGADIDPLAAIPGSAMNFCRSMGSAFGLKIGDTPVAGEFWLGTANNAGTVKGVHASVTVPGSAASVTIDVKKNGTTILSGVITLTNATGARVRVDGSISVPSFAKDDEFTAVLAVGSSTGMQGVKVWLDTEENGQPV